MARHPGLKCLALLRRGADVNAPNSAGERSSSFFEAARTARANLFARARARFRYNSSSAKREDVSGYSWGRRGIFFSNLPDGPGRRVGTHVRDDQSFEASSCLSLCVACERVLASHRICVESREQNMNGKAFIVNRILFHAAADKRLDGETK